LKAKKKFMLNISKFLSLIIALALSSAVFSQNMDKEDLSKNAFLSTKTTPVSKGYKNTKGSIYTNEEFKLGSVIVDRKVVASNVGLRYNVQDEEMEYKKSVSYAGSVANVVKKATNVSVRIGNDTFVFLPSTDDDYKDGYFLLLEEGEISVYKKYRKVFVEGQESFNSYTRDVPDTFKQKEFYYISKNGGELKELSNSRSKRKKFFSDKTEMSSYLKDEKLNLRNEIDFIKAVKHFNKV
jgi:hypothetical protein